MLYIAIGFNNKKEKQLISISEFKRIIAEQDLNVSVFCKKAGLNYNTIYGKLKHERELNVQQSKLIESRLNELNINYKGV